jgi:hypothetical protein
MSLSPKDIHATGRLIRIGYVEGDKYEALVDPEETIKAVRASGARVDILTFMQTLSTASRRYPYLMEMDNFAALPVSTFDHWYNKTIGFKVRNKVKKAAKGGVTVKEVTFDDALVQGISGICNESPIRQGRRFWHYGQDLETIRRVHGTFPDRSIFIGAFFDGALIGFAKLVTDRDNGQAGLMHIISMIKHRDKAPTNALIAQAVRSCADRHIPYLVYSNFAYGNKQRDTLSDFKEGNGFERRDVPRYYVPLTIVGSMALRLGLHHGLAERIPESLLSRLRELRNSWYSRKFQLSHEA